MLNTMSRTTCGDRVKLYLDNDVMKKFARALRKAREASLLSGEDVARRFGITRSAVSQWESEKEKAPKPGLEKLVDLAELYQVDLASLLKGEVVTINRKCESSPQEFFDRNVSPYQHGAKKFPVYASVRAGDFKDGVPARTPADELWEEYPRYSRPGPEAIWLIVDGDSMDDGSSNAFRLGDLILVDPEAAWASGDFVIVANGGEEWTFKRIRKDGPTWYMEALNPGYQPRVREIPEGWRVVAKVLEVSPKGRKL